MNLGLFELTVFLTDDAFDLEVFAGEDRDQVESPQDRYRIVQASRTEIVREILLKLERALARGEQAIDVTVQGSREIVRDPKFPLPTAAATSAAMMASTASSRGLDMRPPAPPPVKAKRTTTTKAKKAVPKQTAAKKPSKAGSSKRKTKQKLESAAKPGPINERAVKRGKKRRAHDR